MKYVFLATDDNKMQLYHLLLNAVNFHEKGHEVTTVLECASPKLLIGIADGSVKLPLFGKAMELGIIDHACKACTAAFSATEAAQKLGVPIKGELSGHSDLLKFVEDGYSIFTF
ncbi:MAG: cytoplasmic protein [Candidatus Thorarchaeota archaeon]|nr:cytoplasmic protein [Candidatus Thorarchaeota archaeon]